MGKISILPNNLINLIAAGEVVERPVSVVKELVENSIDSGADKIVIKINQGGTELIEVQDNGSGMDSTDALLAFSQHATSKLVTEQDLYNIRTLGFRGEALASISSVADIELDTKTKDSAATLVKASHSTISHDHSSKTTVGTTIKVLNLFKGIPARKKFLRSPSTELSHITSLIQSISLNHLNIHFELYHNGKLLYRLPSTSEVTNRISDIWNKELVKGLYVNEVSMNGYKLKALIGKPEASRRDRNRQYIFVNTRPISDRLVQRAVSDSFKGFIHRDLHPVYFLFLGLPPSLVDVNVHPRKLEVRFHDTSSIYRLVYNTIRSTLEKSTKADLIKRLPQQVTGIETTETPIPNFGRTSSTNSPSHFPPTSRAGSGGSIPQSLAFSKQLLNENMITSKGIPNPNLLEELSEQSQHLEPVQIFNTYIVYQQDDELIFIDQHAAAESIMYEKIIDSKDLSRSKPLLVPKVIEFDREVKDRLISAKDELTKLGLVISDFGGDSIQVSSTPEVLTKFDPEGFLNEYIKEEIEISQINKLQSGEIKENLESLSPTLHTLIATLACHGSIRAGQKLTKPEMINIVNDLSKGRNTYNCPHGRPVSWTMSRAQIERNFNRVV